MGVPRKTFIDSKIFLWTNVMKRWKLPLTALFFLLVCIAAFYFSRHRFIPVTVRAIDRPIKPKFSRPVRENAVRSEQGQKMNKKTDVVPSAPGMESSWCLKDSLDEEAGILRQEIDENCDGVVDQCRVKELNGYGEVVRYEYYKDCRKAPSSCVEIERNQYGEKIAYDIDSDCDGRIDECHTYKLNDHGDIIEVLIDKGCDGVLEEDEVHGCFSISYNEDNMIIAGDAGNCGEKPENCTEYEYDLSAGIRREKWDLKCDDTVDFCWVKIFRDDPDEWDGFIDKGCDGTWSSCSIRVDNGSVMYKSKDHEVCAKKYEDLVKRNRGK